MPIRPRSSIPDIRPRLGPQSARPHQKRQFRNRVRRRSHRRERIPEACLAQTRFKRRKLLLPDDRQGSHDRRGAERQRSAFHEPLLLPELRDAEMDRERRHESRFIRNMRHKRRLGTNV